jgi:predicted DNA-binding protein (MmcQ/YjbR family)
MNIEELRTFCLKLPKVTEDIKWGADLCFCIGEKMFCVTNLEQPSGISFKVTDEEFDELSVRDGFMPAPYVARYKWVYLKDVSKVKKKELEGYIKQSYELVKDKLPAKTKKSLGLK